MDTRARLQMTDIVLTFFVLAAIMRLAPVFYTFIDMAVSEADQFSGLLFRLVLPLLILALILSVGVSARRSGR